MSLANYTQKKLQDPSTELTRQDQSSSSVDSTCSEIPIVLYKRNQFPSGCLGPASVCFTTADLISAQQENGIDNKLIQVLLAA
jgi:hypothetical protein